MGVSFARVPRPSTSLPPIPPLRLALTADAVLRVKRFALGDSGGTRRHATPIRPRRDETLNFLWGGRCAEAVTRGFDVGFDHSVSVLPEHSRSNNRDMDVRIPSLTRVLAFQAVIPLDSQIDTMKSG